MPVSDIKRDFVCVCVGDKDSDCEEVDVVVSINDVDFDAVSVQEGDRVNVLLELSECVGVDEDVYVVDCVAV